MTLERINLPHKQITRRRFLAGTTVGAASVAFLGSAWSPRQTYAIQASGDVTVRIFPFGPGVEDLYATFADEFQSESGAKLTVDLQPWDNRYPKMLADLAAGQGPDVMFITTDVLIRFSEAEAISPLTDKLDASLWANYDQALIDEVSLDGTQWFVPYDREVPLWLANLDIFDQVGLDPNALPATWDDIRALCTKVKEAGDSLTFGFGYSASGSSLNTTFYPYLYQAGGRALTEDGSAPAFNSAEGVETLTFITELFENEWASQQYLQPIDDGQDPFTLGMQAVSNNMFVNGLKTLKQNAPDLRYAILPVLKNKVQAGFGGMRSWAMSANSKNPEGAAAFLSFLAKPDVNQRHGELAGTFPMNNEALAAAFAGDAEMEQIKTNLPFVFGEQKHKYGRDLMPLVVPEIQAAIIGEKEPQQALDDAASAVQELFNQG